MRFEFLPEVVDLLKRCAAGLKRHRRSANTQMLAGKSGRRPSIHCSEEGPARQEDLLFNPEVGLAVLPPELEEPAGGFG